MIVPEMSDAPMIDCIAGYHLNPWTCGIAKFNTILSTHLGVPVVGIRAVELGRYRRPLLSIKLEEFSPADAADLDIWSQAHAGDFELFLHNFRGEPIEQRLLVIQRELDALLARYQPAVVALVRPLPGG